MALCALDSIIPVEIKVALALLHDDKGEYIITMMIEITDKWVQDYEWLEENLKLLQLQAVELHTNRGLQRIANALRIYRFTTTTYKELDLIIRKFEAFSGIRIYRHKKLKISILRKVWASICKRIYSLLS